MARRIAKRAHRDFISTITVRGSRSLPELGLALIAAGGAYFTAVPFWQGLREEITAIRRDGPR